jgi:HEAT repeat protein
MTPTQRIEKMLAARNVRGIGGAMRDRNVIVRRRAAQALGELGDPAGASYLAQALAKDPDEFVRQWTVDALRKIGGEEAVNALAAALFSRERILSTLAAQALSSMPQAAARAALAVRDLVTRNDWHGLQQVGEDAKGALTLLLTSDLYATWPSGKRSEVLNLAVQMGATPPARYRKELAASGMFVSGIHSVGDLIKGLGHRNPLVRMSAAEKLGASDVSWTTRSLYGQFKKELQPGGDRMVAMAVARAMFQLGDARAVQTYQKQVIQGDSRHAADAARALAEIGIRETFETLFWFVASPPPAPAYRNVPVVLSALEAAGPAAVEHLKPLIAHDEIRIRRLMVELINRCGGPDAVTLLGELAKDTDQEIQHTALDALGDLNTEDAANMLCTLVDDAPRSWVLRALAVITHPAGPQRLRNLDPDATTILGRVLDNREPLPGARVQLHQEQASDAWSAAAHPITARGETNETGGFTLGVFGLDAAMPAHVKVTTPTKPNGKGGEIFVVDVILTAGKINQMSVIIDRFFDRLMVDVKTGGE